MNNRLEDYLDQISKSDSKLNSQILDCWEFFKYPNKNTFIYDLELLTHLIYTNIKISKNTQLRLSQTEFRQNLIKYYRKCVITHNDSLEELEASHIVEYKNNGDSDITNGLLLEANLHKTFDRYYWTINPDTLLIESNPNYITHSIKNYIGHKVNLQLNPFLYLNLKKRYQIYLQILNK